MMPFPLESGMYRKALPFFSPFSFYPFVLFYPIFLFPIVTVFLPRCLAAGDLFFSLFPVQTPTECVSFSLFLKSQRSRGAAFFPLFSSFGVGDPLDDFPQRISFPFDAVARVIYIARRLSRKPCCSRFLHHLIPSSNRTVFQ